MATQTQTYEDKIAEFVRTRREALGLSRPELAKALGLPGCGTAIARLEKSSVAGATVVDSGALATRAVEALGGKIAFALVLVGAPKLSAVKAKRGRIASDSIDTEHFARVLRWLMSKNKVSVEDVARGVCMTPRAVRLYTQGKGAPRAKALRRLAEYFDVYADEFLPKAK